MRNPSRILILWQKVPYLTVELAFRNEPFAVNKDGAEILVRVRADRP